MSQDERSVDKTRAMAMPGVESTLASHPIPGAADLSAAAALKAARPRVVLGNEAIHEVVALDKAEFIFGRNPGAGADHIIDHPAISGTHCKVTCQDDRFFVQDLGSKNNTFVGGEMLQAGTPREIRPEMSLRIGAVEALFVANVDAQGRKLDPKRYRAALDLLEAEGDITAVQRDRAERTAREEGWHAGEALIAQGDLKVEDWLRAFDRGETFNLVQKEASKKAAKLGMIILIQAIIIAVLLVALVLQLVA